MLGCWGLVFLRGFRRLRGMGALVSVSPQVPEMTKPYQFPALFIPESKRQRFETTEERDRLHLLKERVGFVASLQIIIGYARTQMMNVMESDVAREPLKNFRQPVERAALKRRRSVIPISAPFPVHTFKLMLHVEQPYSHAASDGHDHQLNQQVGFNSEDSA